MGFPKKQIVRNDVFVAARLLFNAYNVKLLSSEIHELGVALREPKVSRFVR
jgi:hypothetical protein